MMLGYTLSRMMVGLLTVEPNKMLDLSASLRELRGLPFEVLELDGASVALMIGDARLRRGASDSETKGRAEDEIASFLVGAMAERAAIVGYLRLVARHNPDCPVAKGAAELVGMIERGAHAHPDVTPRPLASDPLAEKPGGG